MAYMTKEQLEKRNRELVDENNRLNRANREVVEQRDELKKTLMLTQNELCCREREHNKNLTDIIMSLITHQDVRLERFKVTRTPMDKPF